MKLARRIPALFGCAVAMTLVGSFGMLDAGWVAATTESSARHLPQASRDVLKLSAEQASTFARIALAGIQKESPHATMGNAGKATPRQLTPAFYGCFDWHSAVHSHWLLVRMLRRFPNLPEKELIRKALAENLTAANLKAETDFFNQPKRQTFERPYGWAWLLKLSEELKLWDDPQGKEWDKNLKPLTDTIISRYLTWLPTQNQPVRIGLHNNTAFGLIFAHDYARTVGNKELQNSVEERSRDYFSKDVDMAGVMEPGRNDFLSPSLTEADLMRRVLPGAEFQAWLGRFLPNLAKGEPKAIFTPVKVSNRKDAQLIHLDGLNLSRAWCMCDLATTLAADHPARDVLLNAAAAHAAEALPHVASGDYAGEHWLPSFAGYLLSSR